MDEYPEFFGILSPAEQMYLLFVMNKITIEQATEMSMFCSINMQCHTDEQVKALMDRWVGSKRNTILHTGTSVGISEVDWFIAINIAQSYAPTFNSSGYLEMRDVMNSSEFKQFCGLFDTDHVTSAIRKFYNYQGDYEESYHEALESKGMNESDIMFTIIQYIGKVACMNYKSESAHCQILAGLTALRSDGKKYQDKPTKRTEYAECMRNINRMINGESPKHKAKGQWLSLL